MTLKNDWVTGDQFPATAANAVANEVALKAPLASPAFTGTPTGITKAHVGLGNVDNTADSAKPVSTAQQAALDGKQGFTDGARSSALTSKLLGGNITVKAGYDWRHLFAEWDWDNWIKPQVDRAVALGLHGIRLIGAPRVTTDSTISHTNWATSTAYAVDRSYTNSGNTYLCTTAGTSASSGGGPTGTGSSITDGTVVWKYIRQDNLAPLTQSQYDAHWAQLVQYCASKGLYVYPCLCQHADFDAMGAGQFQNATTTASIVTTAAMLAAYPNVIGFDIFQEGDYGLTARTGSPWAASTAYALNAFVNLGGKSYQCTTAGTSAASGGPTGTGSGITDGTAVWNYMGVPMLPADVLALLTAIRAVCNVPVTMSFFTASGGTEWGGAWTDTQNLWYLCLTDAATGGLDFIDVHTYQTGLLASAIESFAGPIGKPIVIGEFGTDQSQTSGDQLARFATVTTIHARPGVAGSFVWALADQGTAPVNQLGVWDNTGFVQVNALGAGAPLSAVAGTRAILGTALRQLSIAQPGGQLVDVASAQTITGIKALTNPRVTGAIYDTNNNPLIQFSPTASAVNYFEVDNQSAGTGPQLKAVGSDTNINMYLMPKGSGLVLVYAPTGQTPTVRGTGVDANHNLNLTSKGTGVVQANGSEVLTRSTFHGLTEKTTPVDADEFVLVDTVSGNALAKTTWADLKALIAAYIINGAPGALDTLKELADALGDDANFATTIANALTLKAPLISPSFTTPALGTPSAGVLTNCTGLPVASVVGDTSTALKTGTVELGHATDTTVARSSAGRVSVEGVLLADAYDVPFELTTGEPVMPRLYANGTVSATPGVARFAMFTAQKTETITQVRTITVGAAGSATLCRIGIFTVDASDNLTLVASTTNDTSMWGSASTVYTKALTASFSKVRGTRYAVCLLQVGGSGATWVGNSTLSGLEAAIVPRLNGAMTGQTDLQSSVAVGSFAAPNGTNMPYAVLLP